MEQRLQVGIISSTHGVRGEVKVFPTTDDVKRFRQLKEVLLNTGKAYQTMEIENVRFFKQFAIVKFKGYDSIDEIAAYKGKGLFVARENAVKLNQDEYFIADLMGMQVENEDGTFRGELKEVLTTGANDVYVVSRPEGEVLIPAIKDCILSVDMENNKMKVHLLDGLLD